MTSVVSVIFGWQKSHNLNVNYSKAPHSHFIALLHSYYKQTGIGKGNFYFPELPISKACCATSKTLALPM
jgi:hypothetical protein